MTGNINEILKSGYKYVLCRNTNTDNFFFMYEGYNDKHTYINVLNKGGSNFEYIGLDSTVKPYIDFDKDVPPNTKNKEQYKKDLLKRLIDIFVVCCNVNFNMDLTRDEIVILDGSRHMNKKGKDIYKYSFHLTTKNNKYVFNGQTQAKIMIKLMLQAEKDLYNDIIICHDNQVDGSVYGRTQRMRTIYGTKYNNKGSVGLVPVDSECNKITPLNPLVYLVKYYEDDYIYIDVSNIEETKEIYDSNDETQALIYSTIKTQDANIHYTHNTHANNKTLITDYRKDIETLLIKKGIDKPVYITHQEYQKHIIYKYCYDGDGVCIYGEHHDRNNRHNAPLYIYVNNGVVMCGCYGSKCTSKNNIKLGSILEKSPLDNKENALQCNEKRLTFNINNDVCEVFNQFITDDTKKALLIKSRCGTGKTHSMYEYINKYLETHKDARILMISTRQSYARAMCKNVKNGTRTMKSLNIINYLEYKENKCNMNEFYKLPRVCISLESLHYIIKNWIPYDIIILDESESICRQLFSTTIKEGSIGIYFHLQKLINIEQCRKVFCLDADLSYPTLELINGIKKENTLMINNTYNDNKREYFLSQDEQAWITDIKSKIIQQKKVFIVCLSYEKAHELYETLKKVLIVSNDMKGIKQEHNDSMLITGQMGTVEKKQMGDVNKLWSNMGLVITTSATGAGVDFSNKNHFDNIYGCIYSGLSPPIEFLQICHRVRHPNNNNIYVLCNSKMRLPEITYDLKRGEATKTKSFIYTVKNAKSHIDEIKKTVITSPILKSIWNNKKGCMTECYEEWDVHYSKLQYYEYVNNCLNNQASNYLLVLKLLIEQHGDTIIIDPVKTKQTRDKRDKKNLLNEIKIKGLDCNELRLQQETTAEDRHIFQKNKMKKKFRIDDKYIDDDINDICDVYTKNINIYENTKYVHMYEETKQKESIKKENKQLYDTYNNKVKQNQINIYTRFIEHTKYDFTEGFKIDVKELHNIFNQLNITKSELKSVSRTGESMTQNKIILTVLRNFGITLNTHRQRRIIDGERTSETTHYTMEPNKEIYECLYMELYGISGYNLQFMNMVTKHNKYMDILTINNKKEQKRLF